MFKEKYPKHISTPNGDYCVSFMTNIFPTGTVSKIGEYYSNIVQFKLRHAMYSVTLCI